MDTSAAPASVDAELLRQVARGESPFPHDVLGAHQAPDGTITVRTLRPLAESVTLLTPDGVRTAFAHLAEGVWSAVMPSEAVSDYRVEVTMPGGEPQVLDDPYRFLPTVTPFDLHLVGEGRHEELWTVLGAHLRHWPGQMGEVSGTSFAVWAPHARSVQVVGDFNGWDGRQSAMRSLGGAGVWELFIPGVPVGTRYKFRIHTQAGGWVEKADPLARATEVPPLTASVVTESNYSWGDEDWLAARAGVDATSSPMSVYEVHLGSWRPGLGYRAAADQLAEYVAAAGFTHVELMPVAEHPFGGSWGYQVTGYYAPTSRMGSPDDFRYLVDTLHQAGIGVILDWVPAHFPKDEWALARFDGEPLYEYPDPRKGEHPDWGTLVPDFGRPEVRNFLVANAVYWLQEFHIDGLRVDAVASMLYLDYSRQSGQWVPNRFGGREHLEAIDFLQEVNATTYKRVPGIVMIAEESTAWPGVTRPTDAGGLGFGLKWNMGWMHDSLRYLGEDPVNRRWHHGEMTFAMVYAYSENYVLPISHDEVVHGKGSLLTKAPGDRWQEAATLRAFLAFMWAHPGKQLLFMGQEFGQVSEWTESRSLDWALLDQPLHAGVLAAVSDLNRVYRATPALWELDVDPAGFSWISSDDSEHDTFSFVRWDRSKRPLVCAANFAGVPHEGYRLGFPGGGRWTEVVNTDETRYGGSGVTNGGAVEASAARPHWGQPASADVRIPPLAAVWFTPEVWPPTDPPALAAPEGPVVSTGASTGASTVDDAVPHHGDDVTELEARETDDAALDELVVAAEPPEFAKGSQAGPEPARAEAPPVTSPEPDTAKPTGTPVEDA